MGGVPVIILCGGRGTRISEVNPLLPKPMLPIGPRPVLWHIMKLYAHHCHDDFVLALGWLGEEIRRFFLNYEAMTADITIEVGSGKVAYHDDHPDAGWRITCVDTGRDSLVGTRVRLAARYAGGGDGPVMVTYGDGVGDIDIKGLLAFHRSHGRLGTVTAVRPPGRFGELMIDGDTVTEFAEKPQTSEGYISGGFFVFEREFIDKYIPDYDVMLEREPLQRLAADGQLMAYHHAGFWQPMDTPRERELLDQLWAAGDAPWAVWLE